MDGFVYRMKNWQRGSVLTKHEQSSAHLKAIEAWTVMKDIRREEMVAAATAVAEEANAASREEEEEEEVEEGAAGRSVRRNRQTEEMIRSILATGTTKVQATRTTTIGSSEVKEDLDSSYNYENDVGEAAFDGFPVKAEPEEIEAEPEEIEADESDEDDEADEERTGESALDDSFGKYSSKERETDRQTVSQ